MEIEPTPQSATHWIRRLADGDAQANSRLLDMIYGELRLLADVVLARMPKGSGTIQATALVHDAYLRLVEQDQRHIENRRHFFGVAAKAMRSVLVDHARARRAAKRGGGARRVPEDDLTDPASIQAERTLQVHDALDRLAVIDEQLSKVVELRFFGGLSAAETAEVLDVSERTVDRGWRTARAWLRAEFGADADSMEE